MSDYRPAPMSSRLTMLFFLVAGIFVLPVLAASVAAQPTPAPEPVEDAALPNVGHTRHHHPRTPKLPATTDPRRLTTSRANARSLPVPDEQDAFTFVIFGDRTGGPVEGIKVLADAVRDVNLLTPDLVMTVGDLVQGYNSDEKWLEQMREYKAVMDRLLCPWFPVAGNHDIYWRGPADQKPVGEHEKHFETHFGPLWYAVKHKNCVFIALFSDEGNPQTGEKSFAKPESQRMSPEQFNWLRQTLEENKTADHIFLFLHHPRWLGTMTGGAHNTGYGDDWNRVHELLKANGNVTAVFAGHIHEMRYDPKDGIEYVTLATTGGGQSGLVPQAGFLHQYHVVTVRKKQVALAAFPVGQALDVREITGAMVAEVRKLANSRLPIDGRIKLASDGSAGGEVTLTLENPTERDIDVTVSLDSRDSRWHFTPERAHGVIKPGEKRPFVFSVMRPKGTFDDYFRPARALIDAEYLAQTFRYTIPQRKVDVPLDLDEVRPAVPSKELALKLNGKDDAVVIPSSELGITDGPLTLECWFNAEQFPERTGLICKTQGSDYGIFVNAGRPSFSVFLGDGYATVRGEPRSLEPGKWYHVAGVYDGKEARLYLDGKLVASGSRPGARKRNDLPLIIGGDVGGDGSIDSPFTGMIDGVRISKVARYVGESFEPKRRPEPDESTTLLLNFDGKVGPWLLDESPMKRQITPQGSPAIVPAD